MINIILQEGKKYLESEAYRSSLGVVTNDFVLSEDEVGYVSMVIHEVISGVISEESFVRELKDVSDIKLNKIEKIFLHVKERIFAPFKKHLAELLKGSTPQTEPVPVVVSSNNTLRQSSSQPTTIPHIEPVAQHTQPTPDQNPTKASLLSEIESPQRTIIKKYVIEHEPITDPEHIIDDTVDERLKLNS